MKSHFEGKVNGISILRVVATLMIVMVHFGQSLPLPETVLTIVRYGANGVILFFAFSGYLIAASFDRDSRIGTFYKKRIVRILPPYYAVVIVCMISLTLIGTVTKDTLFLGWGRYFLFLQTILPSTNVDLWNNCAALWTMSAFALFYILAPFFVRIYQRGEKYFIALIIGLCAVNLLIRNFITMLPMNEMYEESLSYLSGKSAVGMLFIFVLGMFVYYQVRERNAMNGADEAGVSRTLRGGGTVNLFCWSCSSVYSERYSVTRSIYSSALHAC